MPYEDHPRKGKDRPVVIIGRTGSDLGGVDEPMEPNWVR